MTVIYRGDRPAGEENDLEPAEVDGNFWSILQRIITLETGGALPGGIEEVVLDGMEAYVYLEGVTEPLGPYDVPYRVFTWRGEWEASTEYAAFDAFYVPGVGIYTTMVDKTSATEFTAKGYHRLLKLEEQVSFNVADVAGDTYTLAAGDAWKFSQFVNIAGCDVTVDDIAVDVGTEFAIRQATDEPVTLIEGSAALNPLAGHTLSTAFRGGVVFLKKVADAEFDMWGDFAPAVPENITPPVISVVTA